ncbi:MAG: sulfate transporter family protein [Rhizobiales bacterium]|nr:sulfate transporter family protein [Hyphomicrobiales bacterium]
MVIESARKAASVLTKPKFRSVLLKSIGLTILLFMGVWIGVEAAFASFITPALSGWPWVATIFIWLLGTGIIVGAGFLLAPVSAIFAGLFLDDVADFIENSDYPQDGIGQPIPIGHAIWLALRFLVLVVGANILTLFLVPFLGLGFGLFFIVNGYLLGREYFTFAAMRFRSEVDAKLMRQRNSTTVFLGGMIIAGFMAVPILNLATPVFAAALMVHLHKNLTKKYSDNSVPNYS